MSVDQGSLFEDLGELFPDEADREVWTKNVVAPSQRCDDCKRPLKKHESRSARLGNGCAAKRGREAHQQELL